MQDNSSKGFWNQAIVVAIVVALLGAIGYLIKYVIERDRTDLIVRAEGFEQIVPLDGPIPTYENQQVYCEAVRYHLIFSHNQDGTKPIRLKRLALEALPIAVDNKNKPNLDYTINASALEGFGIVNLKEYVFSLSRTTISGRYLESRTKSIQIDPKNIFRSTRGTTAVTIEPKGDHSFLQSVIVVETSAPGLYKVRVRINYEIAGNAEEKVTSWVYVFMQ